jgi:hypothetical protein
MMADVKKAYGTKTALTITLTSLANAAGRGSTVVSNTTDKFEDVILQVQTAAAAANTGVVNVYVYAALGDTTYDDAFGGTDAAATQRNAQYLDSITLNGTTVVTKTLRGIAAAFGGVMPEKWGVIVANASGGGLSATGGNHTVNYQGVYTTVA